MGFSIMGIPLDKAERDAKRERNRIDSGKDPWGAPQGPTMPTQAEIDALYAGANADAAAAIDPLKARVTGLYSDIENLPTFTEWQAQSGNATGDTSGIQGLIDSLSGQMAGLDPNSDAAKAYASEMGGFDSWDARQEFMQGLMSIMENQEGAGMSPEDLALQQKSIRRNTAEMERRAERMIADKFSETGSYVQMFAQADESLNMIADKEIQMSAQLAADNRNLKFQQYMAAADQYAQQYQQGDMSAQGYIDNIRASLSAAVAGYSVEMDAIFTQNEQYLAEYQADYDALMNSVTATLAVIQTELGLTIAEYEIASQAAAAALAPYYSAADLAAIAASMEFNFEDVVGLITGALEILALL